MKEYFKKAIEVANFGVLNKEGGPFGAIVVKDNKIVGVGNNKVLKNNDPTAHAEVVAIRDACSYLRFNGMYYLFNRRTMSYVFISYHLGKYKRSLLCNN